MSNTRLLHLLSLAGASLTIASACYFLGGMIAEAASATPIMGVTFKATGSIAGFLIAFGALFLAYRKMNVTLLTLRVAVRTRKGKFPKAGSPFTARITIIKQASGNQHQQDAIVIWEAGALIVHLRDIEDDDLVMIALTDAAGTAWQSEFFSPLRPEVILEQARIWT
jgi:hypothetical protein